MCYVVDIDAGAGRGKLTKIRHGRDCAVPSRFGGRARHRHRTYSYCASCTVRVQQSHCPNERARPRLLSGNKNGRRTDRAPYQRDIIIIFFFPIVIDFECVYMCVCIRVREGRGLWEKSINRSIAPDIGSHTRPHTKYLNARRGETSLHTHACIYVCTFPRYWIFSARRRKAH